MLFIYTYFPIAYICSPADIIIILISHFTSTNSYFQFVRHNFVVPIITKLLLVSERKMFLTGYRLPRLSCL